MSLTIIYAKNPLERNTWERFEDYSNLCEFLLQKVSPEYGGHFPGSARIYSERINKDCDITPASPLAAEALKDIRGTVYIVMWPAAQAVAVQAAVYVGMFLVTTLAKKLLDVPDEQVTNRKIPTGSPNNQPGQRKNTARVLQRIPDIYGRVKCTPDLIQFPYISYQNNLQVETIVAVIGRGEYDIDEDDILEGNTRVNQIPGASLAIYGPTDVPVTDTPQLQIGPAIDDPLLTVIPVREVTGEQLLAPNNTIIWGDDDEAEDEDFSHRAAMFGYPSTGVGKIVFMYGDHKRAQSENAFYFTNRLNVGDKFGLRWQGNATGLPDAMEARGAVSIQPRELEMGDGGDANIPDLELMPDQNPGDGYYEVTAVTVHGNYNIDIFSQGPAVEYTIAVPTSKQAEWDKIILFNPTQSHVSKAPVGFMFNRMSMIYLYNYRLGPFFCNDPNMEEIHLNLIADKGLWIDDGRRQRAYGSIVNLDFDGVTPGGIEIIVEVTPADETGAAIGPTETFDIDDDLIMLGSSTKRDFIGTTFKITPSFTGRFLISAYRNTLQYWRTVSNAFHLRSNSNGSELNWAGNASTVFGATLYRTNAQWADDIKWTHCYSVSTPKYYPFTSALTSLGDVTLVHAKTTQVKYAPQKEFEKNLNMIVTRVIPFWDGSEFGGSGSAATVRGLDAALHAMTTYYIGNIPVNQIDFAGIADTFTEVFQGFGDSQVTDFHHTFDSEQTSLEDILTAIGDSCFVTFYRQGNTIKASADISKENASLVFNHRNKLPGTENRNVTFGTEEDYDGVELEYSDNIDNQLKTYIAPIGGLNPRNPQKIRVAGIRNRTKAAIHAWRAAHRLQYQNITTEFDSCEEAALSIVKDKVLVADSTHPDIQDGDIIRIDGLTVYTSQQIQISGSSSYTLFIQDVDGSVQSIPVVTDDTPNSLVLDGAPSGTLVIDEDNNIYPKYMLVRNQTTLATAFHIKETQFKNQGVYSVLATNYSEGYYFYDSLRIWLPFHSYSGFPPITSFMDRGPYEWEETVVGSPTVVGDATRIIAYSSPDSNSYLLYEDFAGSVIVSYTVACWVNLDSYSSGICRSDAGLTSFAIAFDGTTHDLEVTHEATTVAAYLGVALSTWTHIGVVYDESIETVRIYINGEEESVAVDVLPFDSFDGLRVFAMDGKADEFRLYNKPKNAQFMRELYQKSRFPAF